MIVLALLALLALGYFGVRTLNVSSKVTAFNLKDIGELATQAGYFTTVQTIRKSREVLGIEHIDEYGNHAQRERGPPDQQPPLLSAPGYAHVIRGL